MTVTVTEVIRGLAGVPADDPLLNTVAALGLVLLLGLLVEQGLLRAANPSRNGSTGRVLHIAIAPLSLVFGAIVLARLLRLFFGAA
jgi:hypothetical protein